MLDGVFVFRNVFVFSIELPSHHQLTFYNLRQCNNDVRVHTHTYGLRTAYDRKRGSRNTDVPGGVSRAFGEWWGTGELAYVRTRSVCIDGVVGTFSEPHKGSGRVIASVI